MNVRPEDIANRDYYQHMPTRRARVTVEVDVEWREGNPDYSFDVLRTDLPSAIESVRTRNGEVTSIVWCG